MSPILSTRRALHAVDTGVERRLGADLRLIYGMTAPVLAVVGLVVVLAVASTSWPAVAGLVACELVLLGVVIIGFWGLMSDDDQRPDA